MKRHSIFALSRTWVAALLIASTALAGCATTSDESFAYAEFSDVHKGA